MRSYLIKRTSEGGNDITELANVLHIDKSPWSGFDNPYITKAYLVYDDKNIYVHMKTSETRIKAVHNERDSEVYKDSCMEFFLQPDTDDPDYLNFEINALGVLHLGYGTDTDNRIFFPEEDTGQFGIRTTIDPSGWSVCYRIPFGFLERHFKKISSEMRGNFFKCGDETLVTHYGTWNEIRDAEMDFHKSQYFGKLIFEKGIWTYG